MSDREKLIDAVELQKSYAALVRGKKLTKKAMCDICVPFRDKYGLTDLETLRIARQEMGMEETISVLFRKEQSE